MPVAKRVVWWELRRFTILSELGLGKGGLDFREPTVVRPCLSFNV